MVGIDNIRGGCHGRGNSLPWLDARPPGGMARKLVGVLDNGLVVYRTTETHFDDSVLRGICGGSGNCFGLFHFPQGGLLF
jgi:hypothetical protein